MTGIELASKGAAAPTLAVAATAPAHGPVKSIFKANTFTVVAVLFQIFLIVIFGTCTIFVPQYSGQFPAVESTDLPTLTNPTGAMSPIHLLGFFGTHVMMAIGFGFLYTLLRRYAWSGVSLNYLVIAFVFQWAMLCNAFYNSVYVMWKTGIGGASGGLITPVLDLTSMIRADYTVATVLISFGALIGRVSALQMLILAIWEVLNSTCNEFLGFHVLNVTDPGGSMFIHIFGASCGLAAAWVVGDKAKAKGHGPTTSRHNGTFAMIGTLFLFVFWPLFNGANMIGSAQSRSFFNTTMAIMGSVTMAFAFSKAINGKFTDYDIQNATIAGGVAIGAACDMLLNPWGAILTGAVAGAVSTYGFNFLSPFFAKTLGITDVCSIASLHLMPGLIGGTASAIAAAVIVVGINPDTQWSQAAVEVEFPGRLIGRSALQQGGFQFAVVVITLVWGILTGLIGGWLMTRSVFSPQEDHFYEDDAEFANVPSLEEEHHELLQQVKDMIAASEAKLERAKLAAAAAAPAPVAAPVAAPAAAAPAAPAKSVTAAGGDEDGVSLTSVSVSTTSGTPSAGAAAAEGPQQGGTYVVVKM